METWGGTGGPAAPDERRSHPEPKRKRACPPARRDAPTVPAIWFSLRSLRSLAAKNQPPPKPRRPAAVAAAALAAQKRGSTAAGIAHALHPILGSRAAEGSPEHHRRRPYSPTRYFHLPFAQLRLLSAQKPGKLLRTRKTHRPRPDLGRTESVFSWALPGALSGTQLVRPSFLSGHQPQECEEPRSHARFLHQPPPVRLL